mmetsp:Transcript_17595/g.22948  ORF Transcript_17595/g.22948 Transcript_17595/m.22948 type:complete len:292 (-) Transcript_17595:270-1145(-)|eukprot:CAMPEP_0197287884 /NCGR_PEP_ID=MMETSP0890-20130614/4698_1 /TAXON_ID=44058 ORGANISM="Aureoumbra lagunensis, Strain CCMP1510" /NCGR_SAMPLE_ID=MMETSP0890 /ASSEMBLY_ACC=CAM_ASM_000533 /LENGTH=291 /DNA_ID=CAMNT_0042758115 /DNA_START=109 /DNA_END=984 /DNA_ORIENTATION=-
MTFTAGVWIILTAMLVIVHGQENNGWKTIHVFVGNETAGDKSVFGHAHYPPHSQSQQGQDKTIAFLMNEKRGFFIDLAANDAVAFSNTLMLERDLGWDGVCIEANPQYWLGLSRRKCTVIGAVVGQIKNEIVKFTFARGDHFKDPGVLGGIVGPGFDNKVIGSGSRNFHTVPLQELFEQANVPPHIDYMSLDVEGAEWYIMEAFPWEKYSLRFLTVERPSKQLVELLSSRAGLEYLFDHGGFGDELWCRKEDLAHNLELISERCLKQSEELNKCGHVIMKNKHGRVWPTPM